MSILFQRKKSYITSLPYTVYNKVMRAYDTNKTTDNEKTTDSIKNRPKRTHVTAWDPDPQNNSHISNLCLAEEKPNECRPRDHHISIVPLK